MFLPILWPCFSPEVTKTVKGITWASVPKSSIRYLLLKDWYLASSTAVMKKTQGEKNMHRITQAMNFLPQDRTDILSLTRCLHDHQLFMITKKDCMRVLPMPGITS